MIVTVICTISILIGMAGMAWYLKRLLYILLEDLDGGLNDLAEEVKLFRAEVGKMWIVGANMSAGMKEMTDSFDQYRRDFKLTFDDKFANRVQEIVGLGLPAKDVMKKIGADGKEHIVQIDKGW
jgi:hypothetical protein